MILLIIMCLDGGIKTARQKILLIRGCCCFFWTGVSCGWHVRLENGIYLPPPFKFKAIQNGVNKKKQRNEETKFMKTVHDQ